MIVNKQTHRAKSLETVLQQCLANALEVDLSAMVKSGYVTISGGGAFVHYNPSTGNFIGTTPDGVHFHAAGAPAYQKKAWFLELRSFFHAEI